MVTDLGDESPVVTWYGCATTVVVNISLIQVKWQIPLVMSFAGPERDRSREIRKEAAYFLQQLCQSRLQVIKYILLLLLYLFFLLASHRAD